MQRYLVKPDQDIHLAEWNPEDKSAFDGGKRKAKRATAKLVQRLDALQELLYAQGKHKILIVLQAMDTAGKDSTIRHIFSGVSPQGMTVASFKQPTPEELRHDYLWRVHRRTPGNGEVVIFNRSHYEDVLVVRVHKLAPPEIWQKRYAEICRFEELLANEGTTILKFFLHISAEEQAKRLQDRLDDPTKHWKFSKADLVERKLWPDYMNAYEDVLSKTSTRYAPWYIVPANHNWYRNLVVSQVIVDALEKLNMSYPQSEEGLDKVVIPPVAD